MPNRVIRGRVLCGATVITQDQIRRAGVNDVDSAIRKIGGVFGRQSLDGSPDFALDLRGFGTNSAQNPPKITGATLLGQDQNLKFTQTPTALNVTLPTNRPPTANIGITLKLTTA